MTRHLLGALFIGLLSLNGVAQSTVQVGTGTSTVYNNPMAAFYGYSYGQQIYEASEILAAGATGPGLIDKIRFQFKSGNLNNGNVWEIYIGETLQSNYASTSDWVSGLEYAGTVTLAAYPAANTWLELTLDSPFYWDGTSNLVVGIDENTPAYSTSTGWQASILSDNKAIYYRSDSNNPDPASPPTGSRSTYRPNIQLSYIEAPDCAGTPPANTIVASNGSSICVGDESTLGLQDIYALNGLTYQWQSYDGATWNDIMGATESDLDVLPTSSELSYQVVVGCSFTSDEITLPQLDYTINALPTVVVNKNNVTFCDGSAVQITASGADTYTWSPSTGLDNAAAAVVNASPSATTIYTVTGTDANGCINTTTSNIIPMTEVTPDFAYTPEELCTSGSPISATLSNLPLEADGGNWNYRFLDSDGVSEIQGWSTSNTLNYIPSADGYYTFYYQIKNASCPTPLDSVAFSFAVGFGADVELINYDCNNLGGTINLTNVYGQPESALTFENDFNLSTDGSMLTYTGTASNTDERVELTPSATSSTGYLSIEESTINAVGLNNSFTLNMLVTADLPISIYGTGGADGIAYSFGDDATTGAAGTGHNGKGTKLRLSFDAAPNSAQNGNAPGIYLVYGWNSSTAFGPATSEVLAYSSNISTWKGETDVPVEFTIDTYGKASLTVNGVVIFNGVQLPAEYTTADVSNWKHLFSAQTGGDAMRFAVDDVAFTASNLVYGLSQGSPSTLPSTWQSTNTFEGLLPGTYNVWVAKNETAACGKMIETVVIDNLNPYVDLGNDTTICEGETLVLDAGNPSSSYVWSNSTAVTQTLAVTESDTYSVMVTDVNGCVGMGSIDVTVNPTPVVNGIITDGEYPNILFSVDGGEGASSYTWNFGDGVEVTTTQNFVYHSYPFDGVLDYTVTLTTDSECGNSTYEQDVNLYVLSVSENTLENIQIFPNPAAESFEIAGLENGQVIIYSSNGSIVMNETQATKAMTVDCSTWQAGVYFVKVSSNDATNILRLLVR